MTPMPEPGRVLTHEEVEAYLARAVNGERLFASEARRVICSHEQLRETLKAAQPWLLIASDVYPQQRATLTQVHKEVRNALDTDKDTQ